MTSPARSVLVVDDDPDSGDILVQMLEAAGCPAVRAWSVPEALDRLESGGIGYVITDYSMPGRDGLVLLERIAQHEPWRALPVVMISGHDATGAIARRARALGARFFPKPIEMRALVGMVARELGVRDRAPQGSPGAAEIAARAADRAGALAGVLKARGLLQGAVVLVLEADSAEARRLAVALAKVGARARTVTTEEDASAVLAVEAIDAIVCARPAVELDERLRDALRGRPIVHLAERPPGDRTRDESVSRHAPARVVIDRLATLLSKAPTRRLPQIS